MIVMGDWKYIAMIKIKPLQMNQISALNNFYGDNMSLNQTKHDCIVIEDWPTSVLLLVSLLY